MENSRIKLANEISKRCDNKLVNDIMYYIIDCEKKGYRSDIDIMIKAILDHKYICFHRGYDRAWGCTPLVSAVVIDGKRIHYHNGYGNFSDCLDAWEIISKNYSNGIYVTESNSRYLHQNKMEQTIYDWYKSEYPNDYQLGKINRMVTFDDLNDFRGSFYDLIGLVDTLVIERIYRHYKELKEK